MYGKVKITNCFLFVSIVTVFCLISMTDSAPQPSSEYYSPQMLYERNPEYLLQTLARLRQALLAEEDLENSKRGLDLGLSRGYSGSQAAKHLMGLAAANFAGGPGRRRRNDNED